MDVDVFNSDFPDLDSSEPNTENILSLPEHVEQSAIGKTYNLILDSHGGGIKGHLNWKGVTTNIYPFLDSHDQGSVSPTFKVPDNIILVFYQNLFADDAYNSTQPSLLTYDTSFLFYDICYNRGDPVQDDEEIKLLRGKGLKLGYIYRPITFIRPENESINFSLYKDTTNSFSSQLVNCETGEQIIDIQNLPYRWGNTKLECQITLYEIISYLSVQPNNYFIHIMHCSGGVDEVIRLTTQFSRSTAKPGYSTTPHANTALGHSDPYKFQVRIPPSYQQPVVSDLNYNEFNDVFNLPPVQDDVPLTALQKLHRPPQKPYKSYDPKNPIWYHYRSRSTGGSRTGSRSRSKTRCRTGSRSRSKTRCRTGGRSRSKTRSQTGSRSRSRSRTGSRSRRRSRTGSRGKINKLNNK